VVSSAGAQTTQTSPQKSSGLSVPTSAPAAKAAAATTPPGAKTELVDINSASAADLDALPNIGKTRAAAIIKNRPYKGKDDLLTKKVLPASVYKGIKDKIIAKQT
jgi:competence protein ComEA